MRQMSKIRREAANRGVYELQECSLLYETRFRRRRSRLRTLFGHLNGVFTREAVFERRLERTSDTSYIARKPSSNERAAESMNYVDFHRMCAKNGSCSHPSVFLTRHAWNEHVLFRINVRRHIFQGIAELKLWIYALTLWYL